MSTAASYLVILPTWGKPHVVGGYDSKSSTALDSLQSAVGGRIECFDPTQAKVVSLVCSEPRWDMARRLLAYKHTKMYVNEEGMYTCTPNMCVINNLESYPVFGNIALVVPAGCFTALGLNPLEMMDPIGEYDESDSDEE